MVFRAFSRGYADAGVTFAPRGNSSGNTVSADLKTLARSGEMHRRSPIRLGGSQELLHMEEGSLYPALPPMLIKGWVTREWSTTAENRRAQY